MNPDAFPPDDDLPVYDPESEDVYALEIFAEMAGVDRQVVLHYQELGMISPVARDPAQGAMFDAESLRQLRRLEHLRRNRGLNDSALRLILGLLEEIERLREERRQQRRQP